MNRKSETKIIKKKEKKRKEKKRKEERQGPKNKNN